MKNLRNYKKVLKWMGKPIFPLLNNIIIVCMVQIMCLRINDVDKE